MKFQHQLLLFLILCSQVFIIACKEDDPVVSLNCDIAEFKTAVLAKNANDNFIVSIKENGTSHILQFEDGTTIEICSEAIDNYTNTSTSCTMTFTFSDGTTFDAKQLGVTSFSIQLNPSGYNPLAAEITITGEGVEMIDLRILGKYGSESDFSHSFTTIPEDKKIPVFGLYQDYLNAIELTVLSSTGNVRTKDTLKILTQKITSFDPKINILKVDRANMEPGEFHLVSSLSFWNPNIAYMFDTYGEIRWVLDYTNFPMMNGLSYDVGIERLQNGNLYFGDINTDKIYEVDFFGNIINSWALPGYDYHHNVQEKPDGNFLVTVTKHGSTHLNGKPTKEDHLLELDRNTGQIIHVWDFRELLDENRIALGGWTNTGTVDWIHLNAVVYDASDNTVIVSGRNQAVVKVDYNDNVIWILAPHKDWGNNRKGEDLNNFLLDPIDPSGTVYAANVAEGTVNGNGFEWNWYQHAPMIMPNGNIMLFDNGDARNFWNNNGKYSRAVEYKIDEANGTIQQIWEYGRGRGDETHSRILSDVDYLPQTGNILFCPGYQVFNGIHDEGARIVEVDYNTKDVYFEAYIGSSSLTFHRVERMTFY